MLRKMWDTGNQPAKSSAKTSLGLNFTFHCAEEGLISVTSNEIKHMDTDVSYATTSASGGIFGFFMVSKKLVT